MPAPGRAGDRAKAGAPPDRQGRWRGVDDDGRESAFPALAARNRYGRQFVHGHSFGRFFPPGTREFKTGHGDEIREWKGARWNVERVAFLEIALYRLTPVFHDQAADSLKLTHIGRHHDQAPASPQPAIRTS